MVSEKQIDMIKGYEVYTHELTDRELEEVVPMVISGLKLRRKDNPAPASLMVKGLKKYGVKTSGPRVRKVIGYLRENPFMPGYQILSCGDGYYMSNDPDDLQRCVDSIDQRIRQIGRTKRAIKRTLESLRSYAEV